MEKRSYSSSSVKKITRGALVAALYTALTYLSAILGLSGGVIQFRISEMLCILPIFMPEAIWGLFLGCIISNLVTGCVFWDIFFGSLATLIGAIGAYLLRGLPKKLAWLTTLPTTLANATIVPFVLTYAYGIKEAYYFLFGTVFLGEFVCATVAGSLLLYYLKKRNIFSFI